MFSLNNFFITQINFFHKISPAVSYTHLLEGIKMEKYEFFFVVEFFVSKLRHLLKKNNKKSYNIIITYLLIFLYFLEIFYLYFYYKNHITRIVAAEQVLLHRVNKL